MKQKVVIVNFVARHSYTFELEMVAGLTHNNCKVFAIVSRNMPEIDKWRQLKGIILYEVDGYTKAISFPIKLLKFYLFDMAVIRRRAKKLRAEVIYMPACTYWSWFVNCALHGVPFVYTMHDPIAHERSRVIIRFFNYIFGVKAKKVVILSDVFRDYVKKHYKKTNQEIYTIPSGNESKEIKKKEGVIIYDDQKINFLFQGKISKYKGLNILAAAYKKLRKKYNNVTLTIAGSGDFKQYENIYNRLPDCIVINRWLTDEEIAGIYNDKNVVTVLPYISATQSGVINVAMPNGSPIIATKCGGIVEQIIDNETGYLVEPNDVDSLYEKMEYVVNHKDDLNRIRENAYRRIRSFDWDILAGKVAEIL